MHQTRLTFDKMTGALGVTPATKRRPIPDLTVEAESASESSSDSETVYVSSNMITTHTKHINEIRVDEYTRSDIEGIVSSLEPSSDLM